MARETMEEDEEDEEAVDEVFPAHWLGRLQKVVWDTFDKPTSSTAAKVVGFLSMLSIFVSTIILTLDTLPYFQVCSKACFPFKKLFATDVSKQSHQQLLFAKYISGDQSRQCSNQWVEVRRPALGPTWQPR